MTKRNANSPAEAAGRGLGTRLRHLLELLDGDVQATYRAAALTDYRPRYTPVLRALEAAGPCTIKDIAAHAGISHSAASQTVAQMARAGLVETAVGEDARARVVAMSARARKLLPTLHAHWQAAGAAAHELDAELAQALGACVDQAIAALERRPFRDRIRAQLASDRGRPQRRRR